MQTYERLPILTPAGQMTPLSPKMGVLFTVMLQASQTFSKFLPVQDKDNQEEEIPKFSTECIASIMTYN